MKIALTLSTDASAALRPMASEHSISLEIAAAKALRDWLTLTGHLEFRHELDGDTEKVGEAWRRTELKRA